MPNGEPAESSDADPLQFDHAEFASPAAGSVVCRSCQRPIPSAYFEVNGVILCDACRQGVEARFTTPRGGFFRFFKASVFGFGAALVGAGIIYVAAVTQGWPIGLLSILVGYLVGRAVRAGSELRGGWLYQTLAIGLTYSAIAWGFIPAVMRQHEETLRAQAAAAPGNAAVKPGDPADDPRSLDVELAKNPTLRFAVVFVISFIVAYVFPVALVQQGQLISLLVTFFGLQTAWRMTQRVQLRINGPFRVGETGPSPTGAPAHG